MKQKTSHAPAGKFKRWLIASLVIGSAAVANAQYVAGDTFTYFYGQNVQGDTAGFTDSFVKDLNDGGGYNSYQYRHNDGNVDDTGGVIGVLGANAAGINRISSVFDLGTLASTGNDIGTGSDGSVETITSITLFLYVTDVSPNSGTFTFDIYTGLNSTTDSVSSFTVSATNENGFIAIDIPISVAFSGFTIGYGTNNPTQRLLNTATETNSTVTFLPGFRVNTELVLIPEPAAALLGALGSLFLLRRRRA
jgi:hypothetical protein